MADGTQYRSRPNPHNAGICGQCSRADTVGTVSAVPLVGFGTAWHCTLGGATHHQTWYTQGNTPEFQSKAGFASRRAPVPRYHLPGFGLGNGCTQLRQHSLPVWTGPSPGAVFLATRGQRHHHGKGYRQGGLRAQSAFAPKRAHSKPPFGTTNTAVGLGGHCVPV